MSPRALILGLLALALAGCETVGEEEERPSKPLISASDAENGAEVDLLFPLDESILEADPGSSFSERAPTRLPPRKPLIGIGQLASKPDHEGIDQAEVETLRTYEAVKLTEDNLIGIEPVDAMGLLGVPEQIREDPPAQVWAYRSGGCSLEIYFYLDLESDNLRSLTYELEAGEPSEAARQACLTRLLTPEGDHG